MTAETLIVVVLVAAVLQALVCLALCGPWRRRPTVPSLLDERALSTVVVTLKSGAAFQGALFAADAQVLVLRNVAVIDPGSPSNSPVDGEVILLRSEVDFIQRP